MDIYSFLNSRDIETHCREINHTWNPFDMAVIIGISNRPKTDKHKAWRELIEQYPDMPTPKGYHHESYPSLHEKLQEAIAFDEVYYESAKALLKEPVQGAVYLYGINGDDVYDYAFSSLESMFANIVEDWEREEVSRIQVKKIFVDDCNNEKGALNAYLDYDRNILDITALVSEEVFAQWFPNINQGSGQIFTDDFFVLIPTPFKSGDILTYVHNPDNPYRYIPENEDIIFVLDEIDYNIPSVLERRLRYEGDSTDMTATCYLVGYESLLTQDATMGYDRFEYYRGKLKDSERLLQYVSWYLKDEISLSALLSMQCRIYFQDRIKNDLDVSGWLFPENHIIAKEHVDHEQNE